MTDLRTRIAALMPRARKDLAELVAFRSIADPEHFPAVECDRAAQWVVNNFVDLGFADARRIPTADGSEAVVGTRMSPVPNARTVTLYAHLDVQPPLDDAAWRTPPFELTEVDGRWYGRGSADCKGNIVTHLTALRALGADIPVHLKLVVEGSEEQGTGGLEQLLRQSPELARADAILVCDTGNAAVGRPAVTVSLRGMVDLVVTVTALDSAVHSGMFGGAAPDALAALVSMLATLRSPTGATTIHGLAHDQTWWGEPYPADRFRRDAGVIDGVRLLGESPADMLWARPAVTILGIDCPSVADSAAAITPRASARLNLRVPPGTTAATAADALVSHLHTVAPWNVRIHTHVRATGDPFHTKTTGRAHRTIAESLHEAYGTERVLLGQGGSIPLCTVLGEIAPDAELILMGVEDPAALIHAPNESVDPREIAAMALAEALFLHDI
ncbi:dipeptidase [Actinokineospora enzanensis]|uniref:dipeptidase n=1 Tax=Actinokineospora enzanensis TaxID=155975 RepID=UPI00035C86BC|nr:dipeptidase [Actinokineospora enzanensis]